MVRNFFAALIVSFSFAGIAHAEMAASVAGLQRASLGNGEVVFRGTSASFVPSSGPMYQITNPIIRVRNVNSIKQNDLCASLLLSAAPSASKTIDLYGSQLSVSGGTITSQPQGYGYTYVTGATIFVDNVSTSSYGCSVRW